jgi:hypothetical protein
VFHGTGKAAERVFTWRPALAGSVKKGANLDNARMPDQSVSGLTNLSEQERSSELPELAVQELHSENAGLTNPSVLDCQNGKSELPNPSVLYKEDKVLLQGSITRREKRKNNTAAAAAFSGVVDEPDSGPFAAAADAPSSNEEPADAGTVIEAEIVDSREAYIRPMRALLQRMYPTTDDAFVERLVNGCLTAWPDVTPAVMVAQTDKAREKNQNGVGLFLTTVPRRLSILRKNPDAYLPPAISDGKEGYRLKLDERLAAAAEQRDASFLALHNLGWTGSIDDLTDEQAQTIMDLKPEDLLENFTWKRGDPWIEPPEADDWDSAYMIHARLNRIELIWELYWLQENKRAARIALWHRVNTMELFERIEEAVVAQAPKMMARDKPPTLATWVQNEGWLNKEPEIHRKLM